MLGKYVRVRVVKPIGSTDEKTGYNYPLNYGTVYNTENQGAFIMGIHHPVSNFDGRVIAVLSNRKNGKLPEKYYPERYFKKSVSLSRLLQFSDHKRNREEFC